MDKILPFRRPSRPQGRPPIGLDIGSSAVRAVELRGHPQSPVVVALGQVGLPPGAVVEGEVRDEAEVAAALKRLWSEAGFSTRKVVVGVGGQRVIVREADVSAMSAPDFRSAMSFEVQDLIPIPIAEAVADFQIIGEAPSAPDGRARMRILLAASDRQVVLRIMDTLRRANLYAVAVDVPQAALVRGARVHSQPGPFALVSVGADLTNVVVGTPSSGTYSRTLAVGARSITGGLGIRLGVEPQYAEAVKRYASGEQQAAIRASFLVAEEARPIVEQIRESLEYFLSRTEVDQLDTVMLTGGGAQTPGFAALLQDAVGAPIQSVDAFAGLDATKIDAGHLAASRSVMVEATGLAAWGWELSERRLSLLPSEVVVARQRHRMAVAGVAAAGVLVLSLGGAWFDKHQQVSSAQAATAQAKAQSQALQDSSRSFGAISAYFASVDARQASLKGIAGGVDWPALIRQISAAMPPNTRLEQLTVGGPGGGSASTTSAASTPATGSGGAGSSSGSVTMSIQGTGGVDLVATWLRAMAAVPSLSDVFVASSSTDGNSTSFSCTASITPNAPKVSYAWEKMK